VWSNCAGIALLSEPTGGMNRVEVTTMATRKAKDPSRQQQGPDMLALLRDIKALWDEAGLGDDPERSEDVYSRLSRAIALASAPAGEEEVLARISTLAAGLADRYAQNRIRQAVQDVKDRRSGKDW
jgi:hypothetical protein